MTLVAGAVLPHAPLLLPEVTTAAHSPEVVSAARSRVHPEEDVTVVVSGHGRRAGVYAGTRGSLAGFGLSDIPTEVPAAPDVAKELAAEWGKPLLQGGVDHGITVALRLARLRGPVVGVCFEETTGPGAAAVGSAVADAGSLSGALAAVPGRTALIASAHTAASLTPRAPLTELPAGRGLDDAILDALGKDVGKLAAISSEMWTAAGSCGAGPLTVLGLSFAGRPAKVHAYAYPVGVGYLVATVGEDG